MEQFQISEHNFPGSILELTDSCQQNEDSSQQSKHHDQMTQMSLRKKKVNPQKQTLLEQLSSDEIYWNCVQNSKLFIQHLEIQGYSHINDYLKYCNKKGVLIEDEIFKINDLKPLQAKYNQFQCKIIHDKNYDYQNIQEALVHLKQVKKTIKYEEKQRQNVEIQFFYSDTPHEKTSIHQTREHRYIAPNIINKLLYEVQPLDIEFDDSVFKTCWASFCSYYNECLDSFQKDQQIKALRNQDDESETMIIDYDQISTDSLAPHFTIAPAKRQPKYQSIRLNQISKKLKILKSCSQFKI